MKKKVKDLKKKVFFNAFFNASVILAGLKSPTGGSAKVLRWSKTRIITGVTSEIVLDEVVKNAPKIGLERVIVVEKLNGVFNQIVEAPKKETVEIYQKIVIDEGDAHILASAQETKASFLVTLDKKHLLSLKNRMKWLKILTPGELIELLP